MSPLPAEVGSRCPLPGPSLSSVEEEAKEEAADRGQVPGGAVCEMGSADRNLRQAASPPSLGRRERGIPKALDEAAILDGASHFAIYRKVVFPLLKPAVATVVIIKGVAIYNEFYIPFLYMPKPGLGVVATSLFHFKGPFDTRWEVVAAGVVIAIIQRYIYSGFTRGAVK